MARSGTHYQALRALANRLVGILHGYLRTHTLSNEHLAWHNEPDKLSPAAIAPRSTHPKGGVFESDECDRSRRRFCFRGRTCRFAVDAVAQHQEWQPEEPKRVISAQLAVRDVDIEFLFETRHSKCRQLA